MFTETGQWELMEGEVVDPEPYEESKEVDGETFYYDVYPEDELWDRRDK